MAFPAGVSRATITIGQALTAVGSQATLISARVAANRPVVWAATGDVIYSVAAQVKSELPSSIPRVSFEVAHVNQSGFVDRSGAPTTFWAYTVEIEVTFADTDSDPIKVTKTFQPLVGQDVIDLDLVPEGGIEVGVTAPTADVISVVGQTGIVSVEEIAEALEAYGWTPGGGTGGGFDGDLDTAVAALLADGDSQVTMAIVGMINGVVGSSIAALKPQLVGYVNTNGTTPIARPAGYGAVLTGGSRALTVVTGITGKDRDLGPDTTP